MSASQYVCVLSGRVLFVQDNPKHLQPMPYKNPMLVLQHNLIKICHSEKSCLL